MTALVIVLVIIAGVILCVCSAGGAKETGQDAESNKTMGGSGRRTMRCPNCGSPATVRGDRWECGYCGDSGRLTR